MIERSIIEAAAELRRAGEELVVATVVAVRGSAYRRPGARMILAKDRWVAGAVSGGCLEGDILKTGWWRTEAGQPVVLTYDSAVDPDADDEEIRAGLGLGCHGVVDVMIERDPQAGVDPLTFAAGCMRDQVRGAVVTVFRSTDRRYPVGLRGAVRPDESTAGDASLVALLERELVAALAAGESSVHERELAGGAIEVLVEAFVPPPRLFVLGTGYDAVPVVDFARHLGWEVIVVGETASAPTRQRFARADLVVFAPLGDVMAHVDASDRSAVVIMNHRYDRDVECLDAMLETRAAYLGVLGPRRRTARMLGELGLADSEVWSRLHAPVGLELGAETPSEIALAIVAEVQATFGRAPATPLREHVGPIHVGSLQLVGAPS